MNIAIIKSSGPVVHEIKKVGDRSCRALSSEIEFPLHLNINSNNFPHMTESRLGGEDLCHREETQQEKGDYLHP